MNASNDLLIQNYDEVNEWNKYQKNLSLNKEKQDETEKNEVIRKLSETFGLDREPDLLRPFEDGVVIEDLAIEVIRKRSESLNLDQESTSKILVEHEDITAALEIEVVLKRNEVFGFHQRLRLLLSVDEGEVIAALLWMTEQGKRLEDLIAVKNFSRKSEFSSDDIRQLCDLAEKNILRYLNHFKVIGIPDNFNEFKKDIYSFKTNPSYSIIVTSDEAIERIRAKYPTGKWKQNKATLGHSKDDQFKQFLEHVVDTTMIDIIQLDRSIDIQLKQQVETAGAEILRVLSGGGIILSTPNAEIRNRIVSMDEVSKVEQYIPSISLEEKFIEYLTNDDELATPSRVGKAELTRQNHDLSASRNHTSFLGLLIAIFFKKEYRDKAAQNLGKLGICVVEEPGENMLVVDLINHPDEKKAFWTVFNQPGLRSIEEDTIPEVSNTAKVRRAISGDISKEYQDFPWKGHNEIVAVADTGLDTGNKETLHIDLRPQASHIESYPVSIRLRGYFEFIDENSGAVDLYSGHGTHVAGSVIGNGTHSQQQIRGIAPEAQLIFQGLEKTAKWTDSYLKILRSKGKDPSPDIHGGLYGIPTELEELFEFAYARGARIHSNSWGGNPGKYTSRAESTDSFMWRNKDFLIVIAAGNNGQHKEQDNSWIDVENTINSPGTSKNCLTVGACENHQFPDLSKTYGVLDSENFPDPPKFPYYPFNQDEMADSFDDIAAFSSRGCFENGRYKPDVVAPGTLILSTRSSHVQRIGSLPHETDEQNYMYMCGTSMATPLVAGGAALVRQYLRQEKKIENPSAALIKATIIHSAQYVKYRFKNPKSYPYVDHEQGWGRVTLSNSLTPKKSIKVIFEDRKEGLIEDEEYKFQILVENNSEPLKIIMAYTDYPWDAARGNESKLVNNLNLIAYTPSGAYYIGNHFDEERGFDEKWLDKINNVEGIVVESPELGLWTIKVVASEVKTFIESGEKQDFALVASYGVMDTSK
jgi:subtilisin family serine protease